MSANESKRYIEKEFNSMSCFKFQYLKKGKKKERKKERKKEKE